MKIFLMAYLFGISPIEGTLAIGPFPFDSMRDCRRAGSLANFGWHNAGESGKIICYSVGPAHLRVWDGWSWGPSEKP